MKSAPSLDKLSPKHPKLWMLVPLAVSLVFGCERTPNEVERPRAASETEAPPSVEPRASGVASTTPVTASAAPATGDSKIPFEFPTLPSQSREGAFVLAPPRAWIDAALERGAERQTFIYYGGWMKRPGPQASEIETLTQQRETIPNPLIIAMPLGARAEPGQVVLTAWASGTGMQRAIVVEGGGPARPSVRYLDMSLENPSGWGDRTDTLLPNTFVVLSQTGAIGTTAACTDGAHRMRYIITAKSADRLLGYGFAGKLAVFRASDCVALPLSPKLNEGDWVSVPVLGRYTKAKVRRVDPGLGRVWAKYKPEAEDQVGAFALIDTAVGLE